MDHNDGYHRGGTGRSSTSEGVDHDDVSGTAQYSPSGGEGLDSKVTDNFDAVTELADECTEQDAVT